MIARKGWGCLSCAKKLEKYKGRLGEHLNWNNFTHNNYSPPKIGMQLLIQDLPKLSRTLEVLKKQSSVIQTIGLLPTTTSTTAIYEY